MQKVIKRKSRLNINSSIIQVVKISSSMLRRISSLFCLHSSFFFFKNYFLKYFKNHISSSLFYYVIYNSMMHSKYLLNTHISCDICDIYSTNTTAYYTPICNNKCTILSCFPQVTFRSCKTTE